MSIHTTETQEYTVDGVTCSHCVAAVRAEVSDIEGVAAADVDLASGRMTVTGANLDDGEITAAVAEAGYSAARVRTTPLRG